MPVTAPDARIADLPVFRALRLADGPAVILGNDILRDHRVVIAHSTGTLYLSRSLPISAVPTP